MGFYAPAQITQELRRTGATVLPVDVTVSEWHCTLERCTSGPDPALRLGLCLVRGLAEASGARIVEKRCEGPFRSIDELAARAQLSRRSVQSLAAAGALRPLSAHRHEAHWRALGVEKLPGLIEGYRRAKHRRCCRRPPKGGHPGRLSESRTDHGPPPARAAAAAAGATGFSQQQRAARLPDGINVRVGGLITHMQQPSTASGVVFASLEDETGLVNVILWPKVFAAQRRCALESSLLVVDGALQRRDRRSRMWSLDGCTDASAWLGRFARRVAGLSLTTGLTTGPARRVARSALRRTRPSGSHASGVSSSARPP